MNLALALQVASFLAVSLHCAAKRPALSLPWRLVAEFPRLEECKDAPGNAVTFSNVVNKMVSKVDFSLNFDFNVSRKAAKIKQIVLKITKCRDVVSSNNCELFQTWRFDRNPCQAFNDPHAVWKSALDAMRPPPHCPMREGMYSLRNYTIGASVLNAVPLPWEGNVWQTQLSMMESDSVYHMCSELEMKVHRAHN